MKVYYKLTGFAIILLTATACVGYFIEKNIGHPNPWLWTLTTGLSLATLSIAAWFMLGRQLRTVSHLLQAASPVTHPTPDKNSNEFSSNPCSCKLRNFKGIARPPLKHANRQKIVNNKAKQEIQSLLEASRIPSY